MKKASVKKSTPPQEIAANDLSSKLRDVSIKHSSWYSSRNFVRKFKYVELVAESLTYSLLFNLNFGTGCHVCLCAFKAGKTKTMVSRPC